MPVKNYNAPPAASLTYYETHTSTTSPPWQRSSLGDTSQPLAGPGRSPVRPFTPMVPSERTRIDNHAVRFEGPAPEILPSTEHYHGTDSSVSLGAPSKPRRTRASAEGRTRRKAPRKAPPEERAIPPPPPPFAVMTMNTFDTPPGMSHRGNMRPLDPQTRATVKATRARGACQTCRTHKMKVLYITKV